MNRINSELLVNIHKLLFMGPFMIYQKLLVNE